MSTSTTWILIAAVVVVAAAAAVLFVVAADTQAPPPVVIDTLEAWVELSQRPGFKLLEKKASPDYFFAIYRTEANEIAFCYRWRGEGDAPDTNLAVHDGQGNDLKDPGRWNQATPLNATGPLPGGGFVHGMVTPIREDHEGAVVLVFRDNHGEPAEMADREAFRGTVDWDR